MSEHTRDLILGIVGGILGAIFVLLMGCASTQPLDKPYVFELPATTYIFVPEGSITLEGYEGYRIFGKAYFSPIDRVRTIFVEAVFRNGKISPNCGTLGHEVLHQLNWLDDRIICPHEQGW